LKEMKKTKSTATNILKHYLKHPSWCSSHNIYQLSHNQHTLCEQFY